MKKTNFEELRSAIIQRSNIIQQKRAELKLEHESIKREISEINRGIIPSARSFELEDVLNTSSSNTQALSLKKKKLEAMMKLPNYADPEFRKLSIPYLEAVSENLTDQAKNIYAEIARIDSEVDSLREQQKKLNDNAADLLNKWILALHEIGVNDESVINTGFHPLLNIYPEDYTHLARNYINLCKKYE